MSDAADHIAAWQAAGLIDDATAERLRAAAAVDAAGFEPAPPDIEPSRPPRSAAMAMFGPSVNIAEVFSYLGGAFLLAAWSSFMARAAGADGDNDVALGVMAVIASASLAALGLAIRGRTERASRAAGVAFLLATSYAGIAALSFAGWAGIEWPVLGIVVSSTALILAVVLRTVHPSVLTQLGVLAWLTTLAASLLAWIQDTFFADAFFTPDVSDSDLDPILFVVGSAAWWLTTAVVIALIGLREAGIGQREHDAAASRRAGVSRFWAGITAVAGLAMAVRQTTPTPIFEDARVLEPWVGVVALLILSAVLVERAFRRDASSFIYAAALGLIVALTDFNVSYLSNSTEVALLIEGLILIGVGVAADRLRRRVGSTGAAGAPPPTQPAAADVVGETA